MNSKRTNLAVSGYCRQLKQERAAITVTLAGTPRQAFEKAKAALVAEGLSLAQAEADGGLLVSVPVTIDGYMRAEFVYRATILAAGDSGRVVLSGAYRNADAGAFTKAMSGVRMEDAGKPLTSRARPGSPLGKAWARLEKLAAYLEK